MERWLEDSWKAFREIHNCLDEGYFFWDETFLHQRIADFDPALEEVAWLARCQVVKGAELEDKGTKASVVIGNFAKSVYLPFLCHQLSRQSLPAERFEVILVDSADDPAFLPVARFCHRRWPGLDIRAFETHEDRTKTVTTRRNVGARQARNDIVVMFDSDWLPFGEKFLESMLKACDGPKTVVRGTPVLGQTGGQDYGQWLRGPATWVNDGGLGPIFQLPPIRLIKERNDHDFILSMPRALYWASRGFSERCVGGSGIEDNFFNHALRHATHPHGPDYRWAIDAFTMNLNTLPTHVALRRAHPTTLVPAGSEMNGDDWGNPSTLEDLTPLLWD